MKIEARRRPPPSPLHDLESIDHEDFDDDMRDKKSNRLMPYTFVGFILIVVSLYFFTSRDNSSSMTLKSMQSNEPNTATKTFIRSVPVVNEVVPVAKIVQEENTQTVEYKEPEVQRPAVVESAAAAVTVTSPVVTTAISKEALLEEQTQKCEQLITKLRQLKHSGVVMETDENAKRQIGVLQDELRRLFRLQYGDVSTFRLEMTLTFPESMPDYATAGPSGRIILETAPIELVPYCVYFFLTKVVKDFKVRRCVRSNCLS